MEMKQCFLNDLYFFNSSFSTNISSLECNEYLTCYLHSASKLAIITVYHSCSTPRTEVHIVCCRSIALEFCIEDNGNVRIMEMQWHDMLVYQQEVEQPTLKQKKELMLYYDQCFASIKCSGVWIQIIRACWSGNNSLRLVSPFWPVI